MIKALYGHPRAGDLWADKLGGVLRNDGFTNVTGWPSMFIKHVDGEGPQVFDVYVDDLIMLGSREGLASAFLCSPPPRNVFNVHGRPTCDIREAILP